MAKEKFERTKPGDCSIVKQREGRKKQRLPVDGDPTRETTSCTGLHYPLFLKFFELAIIWPGRAISAIIWPGGPAEVLYP